MQSAAKDNRGVGSRSMCDDLIVVASGYPTHIPFRTWDFSVTSTLSPQKFTVRPKSTQPWELTYIFV